jgi:high-affinity iron transporter
VDRADKHSPPRTLTPETRLQLLHHVISRPYAHSFLLSIAFFAASGVDIAGGVIYIETESQYHDWPRPALRGSALLGGREVLQAFVITLREGLEAFLIVAISLAYLRRSGRGALARAVHWGIAVSVLLSVGVGVLLGRASNQSLWEGVLATVAALLVATLTIHMWRASKRLKGEIEGRLAAQAVRAGRGAALGVFLFTLLMITREGMETALLMSTLLFQVRSAEIVAGAAAGTLLAASIAWLWTRYGHRVNLGRFFQVTAVFLLVFVVQLLIYGFHELTEAGVLPNSEALHWATEPYGPDGIYGQYLSYMLVILPVLWLAISSLKRPRPSTDT